MSTPMPKAAANEDIPLFPINAIVTGGEISSI